MYVEFSLPLDYRNQAAKIVRDSIMSWANKYQIPATGYSQKTVKYTHRLGFNREEYFSLFSMTYTDFEFRIVGAHDQRC